MAATLIEAPVMPALTSTRTVVIVEDDDSMRGALGRLLHAAGFACKAYASAEAVMADPDNAGSACVVSDLMLPGMSGLELMAALCARGTRWPLILITAHHTPRLQTDAIRRGAAACLAKPFHGAALIQAVVQAIESTHRPCG
jgi:FixJ family two-component response regulator